MNGTSIGTSFQRPRRRKVNQSAVVHQSGLEQSLSNHRRLRRSTGSSIDLANRPQMVREMRDAADDPVQLDLIDVARNAQRLEPAVSLVAESHPERLPL